MTGDRMETAAPEVAADFWELPDVKAALLDHHFGRFLRAYRAAHEPKVKQADLAAWLGITQGQLSKIERSPEPVHDLSKLERWSRALRVPRDLLWFACSSDTSSSSASSVFRPAAVTVELPTQREGSDNVRRRDLLKAAGMTAVTAGAGLLANTPWQRLLDAVDKGHPVDTATVQLMEDRTADFFDTEHTVPARQLLDDLTTHRATLTTLLDNARNDGLRNRLAVMVGETDALIGWLHFDVGRGNEAANAWRSTLKIAKETGDGALAACALGYWSYLASARNDIAPAIRLLQQAEDYVPGSSAPATRSWIAAREAEELSRLGNETEALRALERSFTAFDFARPRNERVWTTFFTSSRLGGLTVSTYMSLGHRDATAAADSLLASLSPTENKARALALTDLTTLSIQTNHVDRAMALVGEAVEVTTRTETSLARQRLLKLASDLVTADDRSAAGHIREQIKLGLHR